MDFNILLKRFASGNFSSKDEERMSRYFLDGQHMPQIEQALRKEWEVQADDSGKDLTHILHKLHYRINSEPGRVALKPRKGLLRRIAEMSAVAAVSAAVAVGAFRLATGPEPAGMAELQAPKNARVQFTLPDGTHGWLNSGSSLKYPLDFTGNREVELFGEAFFDVTKQAGNRPFTVQANGARVIVWGTRFNVTADENGRTAEVVLEEGKVEFRFRDKLKSESVMMQPGERLVYDDQQKQYALAKTTASDHTQWIDGRFVIRGESVVQFAEQFGRRFNMDIVIADKRLADVRFRATFEDESPEEIMRLLDLITPISYTIRERELLKDGTFSKKQIVITYKNKRLKETGGIYE